METQYFLQLCSEWPICIKEHFSINGILKRNQEVPNFAKNGCKFGGK